MAGKKGENKKRLPAGMYKRSDGLIAYRFTVEGKRYAVYGATATECRIKELEKREEVKEAAKEAATAPTVSKWFDEWIEAKKKSKRRPITPATVRTYQKLINRMNRQTIGKAGRVFGDIVLTDLTRKTIEQLQDSLMEDGLKTRTTNDSISVLKQALDVAYYDDVIDKNPAKGVKSVTKTEPPARDTIHRALTREEVDKFLEAAADSWYYQLYVFLLNTGLRIGEASALAIRDVTEAYISVYKTVTREEVIGYVIREQTKTDAGRRMIDTRPEAWTAFQQQREINKALDAGKVIKINSPVFTLPKGGTIRPDRVNSDIKRICEKVGIEVFTCHAFRATFASRCIAAGMSVKSLMEIMGHTDVQMTLGLYGHAEDEKKRAELLAVNV